MRRTEGTQTLARAGLSSHATYGGRMRPEGKPEPKTLVSSSEHDPTQVVLSWIMRRPPIISVLRRGM